MCGEGLLCGLQRLESKYLRLIIWALRVTDPPKNHGPHGSDELSWLTTLYTCGHIVTGQGRAWSVWTLDSV